jgi:protein tyrosine phosphatase (PTP) superfamily phosphohydrolase (DUF442 family)
VLVYCRSGARSAGIFQLAMDRGYLNPETLAFVAP